MMATMPEAFGLDGRIIVGMADSTALRTIGGKGL
jgi:hypothetical protein